MLRALRRGPGDRMVELDSLEDISPAAEGKVVWLDLESPAPGELELQDLIVTIHQRKLEAISFNWEILRHPPDVLPGPDYILHGILDRLVDNYLPLLEFWEERIEETEDAVLAGKTDGVLTGVTEIRRNLVTLRRTMGGLRQILAELNRPLPFVSEKAAGYLKDVYDQALHVNEMIETNRELTTSIFEIYLSTLSADLNRKSNRMNRIIQRLTVVTSIFMPLTFLVGVYGMNFRYMPELNWRYGYPAVWLVMLVTAGGMLYWFWRRNWLR